ncbi:MAG: ATP-dependent DNA helicase RecG [Syntrophales bacterium]|nr:ATP-dependent DNA helicase RecG [Syntrophales bacterium]
MAEIRELIAKMEKPLRFSARDNFSQLATIRLLEPPLKRSLRYLKVAVGGEVVRRLEELLTGVDSKPQEEKKKVITEALRLIEELKSAISSPPSHTVSLGERFALLNRSVQFIKGVGPRLAKILEKKNVKTVEDLLYFLPRAYEDRRQTKQIKELSIGVEGTIIGRVLHAGTQTYRRRKTFEVIIGDGTGMVKATWFEGNIAYLSKTFRKGSRVILTGNFRFFGGWLNVVHPDFEILNKEDVESLHFGRIVPIYSETEGLNQKILRAIIKNALDNYVHLVPDVLPESIILRRKLIPISLSLRSCHFPENSADISSYVAGESEAHYRLKYEEFFFYELAMAVKRKNIARETGISFRTGGPMREIFFATLPFNLTNAQKRVIDEIDSDMRKPYPMNRMLQGDVGSGKTIVAMAAAITAYENGYQTAIMAPTEILAKQHYERLVSWCGKIEMKIALLTSTVKGRKRRHLLRDIAEEKVGIVVGTHALIQNEVNFAKLGLVIIDEQHRFGVLQRAQLRAKGLKPDVLVMTATPIPRTLAMTIYGDLDVSIIDELPSGRRAVKTKVYFNTQREEVYELVRKELKKGHKVFIVYPLVEESETLDLKDATRMAEELQRNIFPEYTVGLIHGKMRAKEKDTTMARFRAGLIDILVATTVIEVGIDIPEASLMIVEHAERFGLSQLHQLRGRVGRGDTPSTCILLAHQTGTEDAMKRLSVMEKTNNGFKIAEEDLLIRGPGDFAGTKQSGFPEFRVADIVRDFRILEEARADAFAVVDADPLLEKNEHRALREVLLNRWSNRLELIDIG